jgi:hypothetical protein
VTWAAVRLPDGTSIAIGQDVTDRRRASPAWRTTSTTRVQVCFPESPDPDQPETTGAPPA